MTPPTEAPLVSVVLPVYNAVEHVDECLASIVGQTVGFDRLEVVAVDDGSTDGGGARLDRWAAEHRNVRVLHQPNSGAPGGPRNAGIAVSRGEFLFFADPDDYVGVEAFERMLAVASRNGSDVVLGRIRGVGRPAPTIPFRRNVERGDIVTTNAVWSLTAHKLFRRSMVQEHRLRFAEGVRLAEEQVFVVPAYFRARAISVVADYDCYHLVLRDTGSHLTRQVADPRALYSVVREVLEVVTANTAAGRERDALLKRWAQVEVLGKFGRWFPSMPANLRVTYVEQAGAILRDFIPDRVTDALGAMDRIRARLLRQGMHDELLALAEFEHSGARAPALVENDRVYAGFPYFRDPRYALPDSSFDISGELALDHSRVRVELAPNGLRLTWRPGVPALRGEDVDWTLVLLRSDGERREIPFARLPTGEVAMSVGLGDGPAGDGLATGRWELLTRVRRGKQTRELAVGAKHTLDGAVPTRARLVDDRLARLLVSDGPVRLDLRPAAEPLPMVSVLHAARWSPYPVGRLLVTARTELPVDTDEGPWRAELVLRAYGGSSGAEIAVAAEVSAPTAASATPNGTGGRLFVHGVVAVADLAGHGRRAGQWELHVRLHRASVTAQGAVIVPAPSPAAMDRSHRLRWARGRPVVVRVTGRGRPSVLALVVIDERSGARALLRRARGAWRHWSARGRWTRS